VNLQGNIVRLQRWIFRLGLLMLTMQICGYAFSADHKPDSPTPKIAPDPQSAQSSGPPTPGTLQGGDSTNQEAAQNNLDKDAKDEVPKRIFWIIPNFMTTNDQPENQGPLTTKQKYNIAWHQYIDMSAHFGNLVQASISQAANSIPHYGQGWGPFGERFLAQEGDQFTGSMLIYGLLPQLLHQDPRYFRKGRGTKWSRIVYAAERTVIARSDSGRPMFNASQVFGQLGQAGISLSYYPQQDRNVGGLFSGWAINQGYNIGWNQLKEFTPDLNAFIVRHQKKKKNAQIHDSRAAIPADPH
jgi:hypothetical protein